jgi:hypothetical protein
VFFIKRLVENSDLASARKQLEKLRRVDAPHYVKRNAKQDILKDGQVVIVEGDFTLRTFGRGFVKIYGYPEGMDAYVDIRSLQFGGVVLQAGRRARIELSVNGFGLLARKIV